MTQPPPNHQTILAPHANEATTGGTESLGGTIEHITFHNAETGFCVLRVKVKGQHELLSVVGSAVSVAPGEYVECRGNWINDKKFGLQFKATALTVIPPTTLAGIEKYLASGMIKGIGPHFAKKLIQAFGEEVFSVIENQPDRLHTIEGIGEKRISSILQSWQEQKAVRQIMVFLQAHGVGTARSVRIYKTYGDQAINIVRDNPYRLSLDIQGVGFKTADALALKLGIAQDSLIRAQAGVCHVLQELCQHGHCAVPRDVLIEKSIALLEIPETTIEAAINHQIKQEEMIADMINDQECIFLSALYRAEIGVTQHLLRLNTHTTPWGNIDTTKAIPWVETKTGLQLSDTQKQGIAAVIANKISIITGGPGVGKTTVVNSILTILRAKKVNVALCAPTGRAAKRLTETTGLLAKTIHRLLELDVTTFRFRYDADHPLPIDFLVVDEASMIDITLLNLLVKAIPSHAALLLVGDVDQLPSVGPGSVLADLINSDIITTVRLTKIFRQTAASHIIINAHRINEGQMPVQHELDQPQSDFYTLYAETPEEIYQKLMHVVTQYLPQQMKFNPIRDIQVLTPMHRGELGTRTLNNALQQALNPQAHPKITQYGATFSPGDKVMQTLNNYKKEVFNGDIGIIARISIDDTTLIVDYDGKMVEYEFSELDEISLAYATSIHKSQGSEYPVVVMPVSTQHFTLLAKNLLYTGVTRGKKLVVLIGQKKAIAIAVKNTKANERITKLSERLREL